MPFIVEEVCYKLVEAVHPLTRAIKRKDPPLADQLSRAASSISLNLAEGNYSDVGNRKARFFTAAGSAAEVRAALRVAVGRGYFSAAEVADARALLDRVIAMLWRLTH